MFVFKWEKIKKELIPPYKLNSSTSDTMSDLYPSPQYTASMGFEHY